MQDSTSSVIFPKEGQPKDGLHYYCKPCVRRHEQGYRDKRPELLERNRAWKKNNPERAREHKKAFVKNNSEADRIYQANKKARKLGVVGELSVKDWLEVLSAWGSSCLKCGSDHLVEIDHVVPLSKGGMNVKENIQPLCSDCNKRKKMKIEDYRK